MRRIAATVLIVAVLLGLLWAVAGRMLPAPAPEAAPQRFVIPIAGEAPRQAGSVDYARIDARLQRLAQDPAMVGMAVAIVENGQIRFLKGYGVTQADGHEAVTPDTVFRWASLSKGVAADAVASLANDGRLSLDEPVGTHAASLHLPDGSERVATVANLLSHQLGLFGHAQDSKLEDGLDPRFLRGTLAGLHNICAPGSCHAYQNVAYDAASEIVERVTGEPYGQVLHDRFFAPLGMNSASTGRAALMASPSWARPHAGTHPRSFEISDAYYRVPAAGGVNGSIKDLAIWMMAQMGLAPDVLPRPVLAAVQTARVNTPGETGRRRKFRERTTSSQYGLGWRILDYAGHRAIGHHGGVRGYHSMIMFDPQMRSGVVVLWNSSSPRPVGIEYEVMDMVYRLPFRDWLELDKARTPTETPVPETPQNEGSGG
ncbi:MAG TPA: serine hydrolase domain-containing protein [Allosphingosinicella sp.]